MEKDAFYFSNEAQIADILRSVGAKGEHAGFLDRNEAKIRTRYAERRILDLYEAVFLDACESLPAGNGKRTLLDERGFSSAP